MKKAMLHKGLGIVMSALMLAGMVVPVSAAELPEGVIPYTPYDLSGESITVYTAEGELSNAVLAQKDRFTELTGCEVNMIAVPMDNFREKLTMDLSAGSTEYDVLAMTCEKEYIDNGWVEPLDQYFNDENIADANCNNKLNIDNRKIIGA